MKYKTFSDVLIEPQYSEVISRSKVDISSDMKSFTLDVPVISSNMKHVTGPKMVEAMYSNGGLGILHRFCTIEENVQMYEDAKDEFLFPVCTTRNQMERVWEKYCGVSVGVQDYEEDRAQALYEAGAKIFCIDVAHGHHILVKNMIKFIKSLGPDLTIIAGNVATGEAVFDLSSWGADIIKVGIGPGSVCQTRKNAGVGVPQLEALSNARKQVNNQINKVKLIADGGIYTPGDVAKALAFADAVMLGGMIAGTSETPGNVYKDPNGDFYKVYGGSASGETKEENKFVEGMTTQVPFKGHVKYIIREIKDGIRSAFSYSNANNLKEFHEKCKLIDITSGGRIESKI